MKLEINTLFEIGQEIWVPRVYKLPKHKTMIIDGEEWQHTKYVLTPIAKMKRIVCINVEINDKIEIAYWAVNVKQYDGSQYHDERMSVDTVFFRHYYGDDITGKIPLNYGECAWALDYASQHVRRTGKELLK